MWLADILPVTSIQEFFGISVLEAIYCKTYPLLPNRLTYPELFNYNMNKEIFYENKNDLKGNLINLITNKKILNTNKYRKIVTESKWEKIIIQYDTIFQNITNN